MAGVRASVRLPRIVTGLVLAAVIFGSGATTAVLRGWGSRAVTAEVINGAEQPLRSFTVRYSTCGMEGVITGHDLPPGESKTVRYSLCGEGGYVVEALFADGRMLKSAEGYVEAGYASTEVVTATGIKSSPRGPL
jgi:hypothetical protein